MRKLKRRIVYKGMLLLLVLLMSGCGKESVEESSGMVGNVVSDGNHFYYWKYDAECFAQGGIFGEYGRNEEEAVALVRYSEEKEEALPVEGNGGRLAYAGERIYYETDEGICSCAPDGGDARSHGGSNLIAISTDGKALIYEEDYEIGVIDTASGERNVLVACGKFEAEYKNVIYYSDPSASEDLTFSAINVDGSNQRVLYSVRKDLYGDIDMEGSMLSNCATVIHTIIKNERIYFSYGTYAGSAHVYQGGKIVGMDLDGGNPQVYGEEALLPAEFIVDGQGEVKIQTQEDLYMMQDIQMGGYYPYEGALYACPVEGNGEGVLLMTAEEFALVGEGIYEVCGDACISTEFVEEADGYLFCLVHAGIYDERENIGWRTGYRRVNSALLMKNPETGEVGILYQF